MDPVLWHSAVVLTVICLLGWWHQRGTGNAGHADVIWTFGLAGTASYYLLIGDGPVWPRLLAGVLIVIWSLRLGLHVWKRVRSEAEDGRYRAMRTAMGKRANLGFVFFFLGQGLLAWLFALPFWLIATQQESPAIGLLIVAVLVGVMALLGEAVADRQLAAFRGRPENRGKTCRTGLWRYSRHPNYFFEWLHWFSYPLLAAGSAWAGWVWLTPALMLVFLWFVTGIPHTEKQALKSRGDDYRQYQRTTSPFIPWRPRNDY